MTVLLTAGAARRPSLSYLACQTSSGIGSKRETNVAVGPSIRCQATRLLENRAAAHEFTREDRARGGRARAEKIRRRRELRERFEVEELEDLAGAELELLDQALLRLNLLLGSDDDRVALRAVVEVFDRTLGRPKQQCEFGRSLEQWPDMDAALAQAHQKLAARLRCRPARSVTPSLGGRGASGEPASRAE